MEIWEDIEGADLEVIFASIVNLFVLVLNKISILFNSPNKWLTLLIYPVEKLALICDLLCLTAFFGMTLRYELLHQGIRESRIWWAILDSNQWPLACRASALASWANRPKVLPCKNFFFCKFSRGVCELQVVCWKI